MEEIINEYLKKNYYIEKSTVGNDCIYRFGDRNLVPIPTNGKLLITELEDIFAVSNDKAFGLVYDWSRGHNLSFYWKTNVGISVFTALEGILKASHLPPTHQKRYLDLFTKESVDS